MNYLAKRLRGADSHAKPVSRSDAKLVRSTKISLAAPGDRNSHAACRVRERDRAYSIQSVGSGGDHDIGNLANPCRTTARWQQRRDRNRSTGRHHGAVHTRETDYSKGRNATRNAVDRYNESRPRMQGKVLCYCSFEPIYGEAGRSVPDARL